MDLTNFEFEGAKILGSAVAGAMLSGYWIARWKYREDSIDKRFDDLWKEIGETANVAADYWTTKPSNQELNMKAARVMAGITKINGIISSLAEFISKPAAEEITLESSRFLRVATGGNFGVHNRDEDVTRATDVLPSAALFAVKCRRARLRDLKGFLRRR